MRAAARIMFCSYTCGFLFLITVHAIFRHANLNVYGEFSIRSSMQEAVEEKIMFSATTVFRSMVERCLGTSDPESPVLFCSVSRNMFWSC